MQGLQSAIWETLQVPTVERIAVMGKYSSEMFARGKYYPRECTIATVVPKIQSTILTNYSHDMSLSIM